MELKQLASSDDRFAVGGMQFVGGRPTYKLLPGVVGESFALSVAERLNIPQNVIDRATELLDSETRQMGDLIRDMEDQKAVIDEQANELVQKRKELEELELQMKKQQQKLDRQLVTARRTEANKFAKKLEEKEKVLEDILAKLKSDPSKKLVANSWDELKFVRRDALTEAENIPSVLRKKQQAAKEAEQVFSEMVPLGEMRQKPDIKAGDKLVICKNGVLKGTEAVVISISGKRVDVTVKGMPMTMKLAELALPPKSYKPIQQPQSPIKIKTGSNSSRGDGPKMSKMALKALAEEEADARIQGSNQSQVSKTDNGPVMRLSSNTVDCLGECNI